MPSASRNAFSAPISEQLSYLDDPIAAPPTLEATKEILKAWIGLSRAASLVAQRHGVRGHNHFSDRPQCQPRKFQVCPGKGNPDDRDRKEKGGDQMAQRKPPACKHKPDDVAEHSERPGAYAFAPGILIAWHGLLAEWQKRVE